VRGWRVRSGVHAVAQNPAANRVVELCGRDGALESPLGVLEERQGEAEEHLGGSSEARWVKTDVRHERGALDGDQRRCKKDICCARRA